MRLTRSLAGALIAGALATATAGAQVNYTTTGAFTGGGATCNTVQALTATCTGGGFSLVYTGTSGINLASGTITSLGTFNLTGTGNVTVPPPVVTFTLLINQTTPSTGQGSFIGTLSGTVNTANGNFSSLQWNPNQFTTIAPVTYQLVFDNVGPSTGAIGIPINNQRGINALITVTSTPEPGTVTLVVTGLAGLVPMIRRRRKTQA